MVLSDPRALVRHSCELRRVDGVQRNWRCSAAVVRCVALSSAGSSSSPYARAENAGSTSYLAVCKTLAKSKSSKKACKEAKANLYERFRHYFLLND